MKPDSEDATFWCRCNNDRAHIQSQQEAREGRPEERATGHPLPSGPVQDLQGPQAAAHMCRHANTGKSSTTSPPEGADRCNAGSQVKGARGQPLLLGDVGSSRGRGAPARYSLSPSLRSEASPQQYPGNRAAGSGFKTAVLGSWICNSSSLRVYSRP